MKIVGHRGSSESGWTWSRPPWAPRRPRRPAPPILPLLGGGLIALGIALVILAVWLLEPNDGSPASATTTPTPSPTATASATAEPSASVTPSSTPQPEPTATPPPTASGGFSLAAWDGSAWRDDAPLSLRPREGQSLPILVKIERTRPGSDYPLTVRYECLAFDYLTSYDRDDGAAAALAAGGPGNAIRDAAALIPNDPGTTADDEATGSLSVWGGSFVRVGPLLPSEPCKAEKTLDFTIAAAADTVYVLWAAHVATGAAALPVQLSLDVVLPGDDVIGIRIAPDGAAQE